MNQISKVKAIDKQDIFFVPQNFLLTTFVSLRDFPQYSQ